MKFIKPYQTFENTNSGNASFDWIRKQNNERYIEFLDILYSEVLDEFNIVPKTTESFDDTSLSDDDYPFHKFWAFRVSSSSIDDTSDLEEIKDKKIESLLIYNISREEKDNFWKLLTDCKNRFESYSDKTVILEEHYFLDIDSWDYTIKIN